MSSRRSEPESQDSWSVLRSDALQRRASAEAEKKLQEILDKHPKKETTDVPVVMAPTPPPSHEEARKGLLEIFTDLPEALKDAGEAAIRLEKSNPTP